MSGFWLKRNFKSIKESNLKAGWTVCYGSNWSKGLESPADHQARRRLMFYNLWFERWSKKQKPFTDTQLLWPQHCCRGVSHRIWLAPSVIGKDNLGSLFRGTNSWRNAWAVCFVFKRFTVLSITPRWERLGRSVLTWHRWQSSGKLSKITWCSTGEKKIHRASELLSF